MSTKSRKRKRVIERNASNASNKLDLSRPLKAWNQPGIQNLNHLLKKHETQMEQKVRPFLADCCLGGVLALSPLILEYLGGAAGTSSLPPILANTLVTLLYRSKTLLRKMASLLHRISNGDEAIMTVRDYLFWVTTMLWLNEEDARSFNRSACVFATPDKMQLGVVSPTSSPREHWEFRRTPNGSVECDNLSEPSWRYDANAMNWKQTHESGEVLTRQSLAEIFLLFVRAHRAICLHVV